MKRIKKIFSWINNSLIFNMVKMIVIIGILLYLIFYISPDEAYVYMTYDPDSYEVEYVEAEKIKVEFAVNRYHKDEKIIIGEEKEIEIVANSILYNGEVYSAKYLKFIPDKPLDINNDNFLNMAENINFSAVPYILIKESNNRAIGTPGTPTYKTDNETGMMYYNNAILFDRIFQYVDYDGDLEIHPLNGSFILGSGVNELLIRSAVTISGKISSFVGIGVNKPVIFHSDNLKDILFEKVKDIKIKSYGELAFSYSPTPTIYNMKNQSVYLKTNDGYIDFAVKEDSDEMKYQLSGMVSEAELSGMDLFPSFKGWYRDNVLLAPLTLITVIFGGITLMITSRKKDDKK